MENSNSNNPTPDELHKQNVNDTETDTSTSSETNTSTEEITHKDSTTSNPNITDANTTNDDSANEASRSFSAKGSYNPNVENAGGHAVNPVQQPNFNAVPPQDSPLSNYQPMFQEPELGTTTKLKHSGPGITSFIISLLAMLLIVIGIVVMIAGVANLTSDSSLEELQDITYWENLDTTSDMPDWIIPILIGVFVMLGAGFFAFLGLIFGIIGLVIKNRKKTFAVIGTILSGLIFGGGLLLFVLALLA